MIQQKLNIFTNIHDALQEVKQFGNCNILLVKGKVLGSNIAATAEGTRSLIWTLTGAKRDVPDEAGGSDDKTVDSLGDCASKIITSNVGATKDIGSDIGNVFHGFLEGIRGSVKWIVNRLLFCLLWYTYSISVGTRSKSKCRHWTINVPEDGPYKIKTKAPS